MTREPITWDEEKKIHSDLQARQMELANAERQMAYNEVSRAIAAYRWWGWNTLLTRVRLAIQAWRFNRAQKHRAVR